MSGLSIPTHPGQTQAKDTVGIRRSRARSVTQSIRQRYGLPENHRPLGLAKLPCKIDRPLDHPRTKARPVSGLLLDRDRAKDELLCRSEIPTPALESTEPVNQLRDLLRRMAAPFDDPEGGATCIDRVENASAFREITELELPSEFTPGIRKFAATSAEHDKIGEEHKGVPRRGP